MAATLRRAVPLVLLANVLAAALPARAEPPAAKPAPKPAATTATLSLAARSIGSKRGDPPQRRAHAAILVRIEGRPGGFIVQGGREAAPGWIPGRDRVVGYVIPCADPDVEFTRATGAFWGEPTVRELPTRTLSTWTEKGLDEARLRAVVDSLNVEFGDRAYRLEAGPSSNSFVSRFLERLGRPLPPIGDEDLPGWGWKP